MPDIPTFDAIILGGGAAGLMCALTAGQRGRRVLLIDHARKVGSKILISGGGRCNFTNIGAAPDRYISSNPHFVKSALRRYTAQDFIDLVDRHGIAWHEKTLGQLFCDGSARQIVEMLEGECALGGVEMWLGQAAQVEHDGTHFHITCGARQATAPAFVLATGGPSIPKMGATGYAYEVARKFGLKIVEPRPALVPFTLPREEALFTELSGVATPVIARCGKAAFPEAALFTHRGMSGPAILQVSSYWRHGQSIGIDFLPTLGEQWLVEAKRVRPRTSIRKLLSEQVPDRLAEALAEQLGLSGEMHSQSDRALTAAAARLADWRFTPSGTEGFAKAEVTIGGVSTDELSSQTMESRRVPGLFIIGEAVDVTGWLGGYNFQWAWSSGWAAGQTL